MQGKCFHNQQETEDAFQERVHRILFTDFYATGISKLISRWQKCVDFIMAPILINKDVFHPSYNDLKFMVPNCSYVFTNLIKGLPRLQNQQTTPSTEKFPEMLIFSLDKVKATT